MSNAHGFAWTLAIALAAGPARPVAAQDGSGHHLFNPTPRDQWRPLSADRPDATESPITVDAGAVQIETTLLQYGRDEHNDDGTSVQSFLVLATNLKLGLTDRIDLQLVFEPFAYQDTEPDGGGGTILEGFGSLQLRLKANLWGNDGGETALGVLPFLGIPTGNDLGSEELGGGVALPFSMALAEGVSLGLMPQIAFVHDGDDDDHDVEFLHTAVVGFELPADFGVYVEYVGVASSDSATEYAASFSTGATYGVSEDLQLDAGLLVGLSRDAEDLVLFTGFTLRF